ncbi:MAG: tRNA (adenosine(37)-N6)-dimethylallyltransferase MiaA [Marinobacterium sp.]
MAEKLPVLFLMGPTASGKTDLALNLFDYMDVEIISVDSALIYREMDIGTAKPDRATLAKYPHALVDILDPTEVYSASDFAEDARQLIDQAHAQGKLPVLVGGTILYFKALAEGLAKLPEANAEIRAEIEAQAEQEGWPFVHARLAQLDPASGERLGPNDQQRIQRALEVFLMTGRSIDSHWQEQQALELPWKVIPIALMPEDRAQLHHRIELRFNQMLEQGFEAEVIRLRERGDLNLNLPSMRCVGYRQMWQYLDGELDWQEMHHKGLVATRQLAKRQMTWLRSWQGAEVIDPLVENLFKKTLALIPRI